MLYPWWKTRLSEQDKPHTPDPATNVHLQRVFCHKLSSTVAFFSETYSVFWKYAYFSSSLCENSLLEKEKTQGIGCSWSLCFTSFIDICLLSKLYILKSRTECFYNIWANSIHVRLWLSLMRFLVPCFLFMSIFAICSLFIAKTISPAFWNNFENLQNNH